MPKLMETPPYSPPEEVTEILHGVAVTDPYRWLEEQASPRTRTWLEQQSRYARAYLDQIMDRERIRERIRELLDVETYDSIQRIGQRYFFRKRLPGQEQPSIFLREGAEGNDSVLIDPAERGTGNHTAVNLLRISPDGRLLLYEVKEGGERTGTFELLDINTRTILPDRLPHGYLRGFAFDPDSLSFYYVHAGVSANTALSRVVYRHILGTELQDDKEIFFAGEGETLQLTIVPGKKQLGFLVHHFRDKACLDFYLWPYGGETAREPLIKNAGYRFEPLLMNDGRMLAVTDRDAPNSRIAEVRVEGNREPSFVDVVPMIDVPIQNVTMTDSRIFVSYLRKLNQEIAIFDLFGKPCGALLIGKSDTVRLVGGSADEDELFFERQSFSKPIQLFRLSSKASKASLWAERQVRFESEDFIHTQEWFTAKDGTRVPILLVGRNQDLQQQPRPTILTSYGGYGVSMTPQFSVLVAFLIERGCLFALPNIRGGSEFGVEWHQAARRRRRQVAFDDFIGAAEWLIETGRTERQKLAIFGGSNSGLLVGAAMTQRPDLFRAVVCMVPMLDMLRYHLFDNAHVWKEEFGTAEEPDDFAALLGYSPYHQVREGRSYPATMIVSGDRDQNCNPLHARKMTARLQAANRSDHPILLDYSRHRGHSPVLPLSERIEALTDRVGFLCDQLQLAI